jgi:outer membrane protein
MQKDRTAHVDTVRLFTAYKGSQRAKAEYEKKAAVWKANIDTLTSEFNSAVAKHNNEKAKMTAKETKLSEELLAAKQQQLENYKAAISENAAREDREVTSKVNREITDFLKSYGEAHGYSYILGATGTGNIVYAEKGRDITDEVLKELNAQYQDTKK